MYAGQLYGQQPHFTNRGVPGPAGCMTHPISPWQRVAIQPHNIMTEITPVLPYHGTNLLISSHIVLAYSYLHLYIHHLHYCYHLSIGCHHTNAFILFITCVCTGQQYSPLSGSVFLGGRNAFECGPSHRECGVQQSVPRTLLTRLSDNHHSSLLLQLTNYAAVWREIGTHLGFHPGELSNIEARPNLMQSAPVSWLSAMLSQWLQWAPGDS